MYIVKSHKYCQGFVLIFKGVLNYFCLLFCLWFFVCLFTINLWNLQTSCAFDYRSDVMKKVFWYCICSYKEGYLQTFCLCVVFRGESYSTRVTFFVIGAKISQLISVSLIFYVYSLNREQKSKLWAYFV